MFVLNPDPFLLPAYRISPFRTADIAFNNALPDDAYAAQYFDRRFGKGCWKYTYNGREAIAIAMQAYGLDQNDEVSISTTSENFYISSCVTKQIETVCKWNRKMTPDTKLLFVNHEFGYPHPGMSELAQMDLPIIEDCCTTFFSSDENEKAGNYGDFSVYSFPKFFPIQIGGLIVSNTGKPFVRRSDLSAEAQQYIQNVMSYHLRNETDLIAKRARVFEYSSTLFSELGFTPRFENESGVVPSAMLLNNNSVIKNLDGLKIFLNQQGIQNSIFYGEDAFFIPTHQHLETADCDYFFSCVNEFLKSQQ